MSEISSHLLALKSDSNDTLFMNATTQMSGYACNKEQNDIRHVNMPKTAGAEKPSFDDNLVIIKHL